jgi:hypothetical protein
VTRVVELAQQTGLHRAAKFWVAARVALAIGLLAVGCRGDDNAARTRVEFFETEGHAFAALYRAEIEAIARDTVDEVRPLLRGLPRQIVLRVQSADAEDVIDLTGENHAASPPDTVMWTVDTRHRGGAGAVARAQLRAALFHELHHLVRDAALERRSMLDRAVAEGLATAFERDYANASPPWGWYPSDADVWVDELRKLPATAHLSDWTARHPDGRRWIATKAGTYLVDRAVRASGKSPGELVTTPTDEILALAGGT